MIITFYSYKGGVGRTFLAANLAACLCYRFGKKVLLIDWDLEAPGMNFYFNKGYSDIQKPGLIDVLQQYVQRVRQNKNLSEKELPRFTKDNIIPLVDFKKEGGQIDLLPAGNCSDFKTYLNAIFGFNWFEFYDLLDGKRYIEFLKKELKKLDYDYIFIDSRTGLADYADICNIQMPDMNIIVCAPNRQNIDGSFEVANRIVNSPYVQSGKFRKPIVLPILSRVEQESPSFSGFLESFRSKFDYLLKHIEEVNSLILNFNTYFRDSMIGYNRFVAIGENLLFSEESNRDNQIYGTSESFLYLTALIQSLKNELFRPQIISITQNNEKLSNGKLHSSINEKVRNFIAHGNIKQASELLLNYFEDINYEDKHSTALLLHSRLNRLQNDEYKGIIDTRESNMERNRLTVAMLDLLTEVH